MTRKAKGKLTGDRIRRSPHPWPNVEEQCQSYQSASNEASIAEMHCTEVYQCVHDARKVRIGGLPQLALDVAEVHQREA